MRDEKKEALTEVERVTREVASGLGLDVVELVFHNQGRHSQLRIDIDRAGIPGVGIADCERLSRALDERLEALAFVETTYELQVSSPGIDRPIRSDDDIRRNTGRIVRVAFTDETGRVREVTGALVGLEESGAVAIRGGDGAFSIARDGVVSMKQDIPGGGRKRNKR